MNNEELKKKIAERLIQSPESVITKDASLKKGLETILKGVIRGSNFLSAIPERLANATKIQVLGGRELSRIAGPFTPSSQLKDIIKTQLKSSAPRESIFRTGTQGSSFTSATGNVYTRGEKIEGVTGLAKSILTPSAWKAGADEVFKPLTSIAGKEIKNKGMQRALGFLTNNPMDIGLTALEYSQAKSREEKNEILTKGVPTMLLSNTISNLGGKRYSLVANLMAGAIAHKAVSSAWEARKKFNEGQDKKFSK